MEYLKSIFRSAAAGFFYGGGIGFVSGIALYFYVQIKASSMSPDAAASYLCGSGMAPFVLGLLGALTGLVIGLIAEETRALGRQKEQRSPIGKSGVSIAIVFIVSLAINCPAQSMKTPTTVQGLKAKLTSFQGTRKAVTLKLKPGSIYYYLARNEDVKHVANDKSKLSGTIAIAEENNFILNERWFLGQSGELRIRYEDVEKIKVNLVPNALKTTGEILFYCILLMPTGACAM